MVTSIVDSPVSTQVSDGTSHRVSDQSGPVGTGDKSTDKLVDRAIVSRGPRIAVTGIAADALSTPAQYKALPWHP